MTNLEAQKECLSDLEVMYPNWKDLQKTERALLCAAYLCDTVKVREVGGNNRGPWVEAFLKGTELEEGYPWCAAFVEFCQDVAGFTDGPSDRASAAVESWYQWAKFNGKLTNSPKRGDLCLWRTSKGNHIGFVVTASESMVNSIEGNTSAGDKGSQRDGGGVYRRSRNKATWTSFVRMEK
jgi:hypothetical protein